MVKADHIAAIDQGTSGTTVLVFDAGGAVVGRAAAEFPQYYPQPGWVEHDPEEIWSSTMAVMKEALDRAGIPAARLAGIGITNQRETTVLWERAGGRPVAPAIVWQDRRTAELCRALQEEGLEPEWQRRTGLLIDPYFSATKVHWLLEHIPGLRARAQAGDLAFGTIDSWLIWKLTGGRRHLTDYSNASRTMMYDVHRLAWDEAILRRLDIPAAILPQVVSSSGVHGETSENVFFGERIPIAGIAGDQQAALFGQGCTRPGAAKNTYGTGCFLLLNTGEKPVISRQRLLTTIAWRLGEAPVQYALEGAVFMAGATIQWLRDGLGILASAAESETLARQIDSNEDVFFVPAMTGLGAPYWDPYARGTVVGITRGTTRAHIARAALESIAFQTRDVADAMGREADTSLALLRADGGAVANRFLMQFQADILGIPVDVAAMEQTTALGAARLAGMGCGLWPEPEQLPGQEARGERYEPQLTAAARDALYARWQAAVERSRQWAAPAADIA